MTATSEIRAPRREIPRYWIDQPFPAYRYVPGVHPHPTRDAHGHSPAERESPAPPVAWDPAAWAELCPWLRGVDLFNHFYFWEAHEAWEILWRTTPRNGAPSLMLQGLIQISAALLKSHIGALAAARRLSAAGIEKLNLVAGRTPSLMGLDVARTLIEMQTYFRPLADDVLPVLDESVPTLRLVASRTPGEGRS
jgi:hypothetical protein